MKLLSPNGKPCSRCCRIIRYDKDGALREWAMSEYTENNNHRHLSHLYPAWPAYETQNNTELAEAANIAVENRNKYNTGGCDSGAWLDA